MSAKRIKKIFHMDYNVDIHDHVFTVMLKNTSNQCVYSFRFSRDGLKESKTFHTLSLLFFMKNPKKYQVKICPPKLTQEDKNRIHQLFPYIPIYTDFMEFSRWFDRQNAKFDYGRYAKIKAKLQEIQDSEQYAEDALWREMEIDGRHVLFCKWRDSEGNVHAAAADEFGFVSDLPYEMLRVSERDFSVGETEDYAGFLGDNPELALASYLQNGGNELVRFLTVQKIQAEHSYELLSKAGLVKLADNLPYYPTVNHDASTLKALFGLPQSVLVSLNEGSDDLLWTEEDYELLCHVYQRHPSVFEKPLSTITELWMRYVYGETDTKWSLHTDLENSFLKTIRYLNKQCEADHAPSAYQIFAWYQGYLACSAKYGACLAGKYPKDLENALADVTERLLSIYRETEPQELRQRFSNTVQAAGYQRLQENLPEENYFIAAPQTAEDLVMAGNRLHNCLSRYVNRVMDGKIRILFILDKNERDMVGAIEVRGKRITQTKGFCNAALDAFVKEYLKGYARRKSLIDITWLPL